jgi:hypothetical protein
VNQNPKLYFRIIVYLRAVYSGKKFALGQDVAFCLNFELFWTRSLIACIKGESIIHCGMNLKLWARCGMLARTGWYMLTRSVTLKHPIVAHD